MTRRRKRPYKQRDPVLTSAIMAAVRGKNNRAEMMLRRTLWGMGFRYRLYTRHLRGKPDIVFSSARVAVFVDGDYWHGRVLREQGEVGLRNLFRGPSRDWWRDKLRRTVTRDRAVTQALIDGGWAVVRVWESDVLNDPYSIAFEVARKVTRRHPARTLWVKKTHSRVPARA